MDNIQKVCHFNNTPSSQTFRIYLRGFALKRLTTGLHTTPLLFHPSDMAGADGASLMFLKRNTTLDTTKQTFASVDSVLSRKSSTVFGKSSAS
jgi:hypothetical protein